MASQDIRRGSPYIQNIWSWLSRKILLQQVFPTQKYRFSINIEYADIYIYIYIYIYIVWHCDTVRTWGARHALRKSSLSPSSKRNDYLLVFPILTCKSTNPHNIWHLSARKNKGKAAVWYALKGGRAVPLPASAVQPQRCGNLHTNAISTSLCIVRQRFSSIRKAPPRPVQFTLRLPTHTPSHKKRGLGHHNKKSRDL